jgi:hypothetical protein
LYALNSEFCAKIEELTELHNDLNNLLSSTSVGTIFLDADLHIRKFTTAVTKHIPGKKKMFPTQQIHPKIFPTQFPKNQINSHKNFFPTTNSPIFSSRE